MNKPLISPLYQQVYDQILKEITTQKWRINEKLPTEYEFAKQLNVSQGTVRKAFDNLVSQRIVIRQQGKGTFLNKHKPEEDLFLFFRFVTKENKKIYPTSKVIKQSIKPIPKPIANKLNIEDKDATALCVERLRYNEDQPFIFEYVWLPLMYYPDIKETDILPNTLYAYLQHKFDLHMHKTTETIYSTKANKQVAKFFGLLVNTELLTIERVSVDISKRKVEYRETYSNSAVANYQHTLGE